MECAIESKKLKSSLKRLSVDNLTKIASSIDKNYANISQFSSPEFFDFLMQSLNILSSSAEISTTNPHKVEKNIRAILHILHHLFISRATQIALPRPFRTSEAINLLELALNSHAVVTIIPERSRIRAQICCKLLMKKEKIIQAFTSSSHLEEQFCSSLLTTLSNESYFSTTELVFFTQLVNILPYHTFPKSINAIIDTLSIAPLSIWQRTEPAIILNGVSKFISKYPMAELSCFLKLLNVAYRCLSSKAISDKSMLDALFIINYFSTSSGVSAFSRLSNEFKLAANSSFENAILNPKGSVLVASILNNFLKGNCDNFIFLFPFIKLLLKQVKNNYSFACDLISILKSIRNISLEAYRQLWLADSLSFLLKQYSSKYLLQTIDLLCPIFMFSGGIHWLIQYTSEFGILFYDIIKSALLIICPGIYQEDLLISSNVSISNDFGVSFLKHCLSFFRLGSNRSDWVEFCMTTTHGKLIAVLASIVYYFLDKDIVPGKVNQYFSLLYVYSGESKYKLFLLWPIVTELRKNFGFLDLFSIHIARFLDGLKSKFDVDELFLSIASSFEKDLLFSDVHFSLAYVSIVSTCRFINNYFSSINETLFFQFKNSLLENSSILQKLSLISTSIENLDLRCSESMTKFRFMFDNQTVYASVDEFICKIPDTFCKFCYIVSLLGLCYFLDIPNPVSFLWTSLRKSITYTASIPSKHIIGVSFCLSELFKLLAFKSDEFRLTLSHLVFVLKIQDFQPYFKYILNSLL